MDAIVDFIQMPLLQGSLAFTIGIALAAYAIRTLRGALAPGASKSANRSDSD